MPSSTLSGIRRNSPSTLIGHSPGLRTCSRLTGQGGPRSVRIGGRSVCRPPLLLGVELDLGEGDEFAVGVRVHVRDVDVDRLHLAAAVDIERLRTEVVLDRDVLTLAVTLGAGVDEMQDL